VTCRSAPLCLLGQILFLVFMRLHRYEDACGSLLAILRLAESSDGDSGAASAASAIDRHDANWNLGHLFAHYTVATAAGENAGGACAVNTTNYQHFLRLSSVVLEGSVAADLGGGGGGDGDGGTMTNDFRFASAEECRCERTSGPASRSARCSFTTSRRLLVTCCSLLPLPSVRCDGQRVENHFEAGGRLGAACVLQFRRQRPRILGAGRFAAHVQGCRAWSGWRGAAPRPPARQPRRPGIRGEGTARLHLPPAP
jgi:hypothetical protein